MKHRDLFKKAIAITLGITLAFGSLMLPDKTIKNEFTTASAYSVTTDGCEFQFIFKRIDSEMLIVLDNVKILDGSDGVVRIPSTVTVDGKIYPVTMVGNKCMYEKDKIKEVIFPDSVTFIGNSVLRKSSVEKITLPDGLEHIGIDFCRECGSLDTVTYEGTNIVGNNMGRSAFKDANREGLIKSGILDEETNIKTFGNWLLDVPADLEMTELKISDLSKKGVKIDGIAEYAIMNLSPLKTIDLEGVKYLTYKCFYGCNNLNEFTNADDVIYAQYDSFEGTGYIKSIKDNDLTMLGNVILYYKTDSDTLDLTSPELAKIRCIVAEALRDCKNIKTIKCDSDFIFQGPCLYKDHPQTDFGESEKDRLPLVSTYKLEKVYLDGEPLTYERLLEDHDAYTWFINNYTAIEQSEFVKKLTEEKTKVLFDQLGITYYGMNNDKLGTLTPTEEFYIRLKIHNYLSMYLYDSYSMYNGFAECFLLGAATGCGGYAELAHYLLHCAGVNAKTYYANNDDITSGVHYWNSTKIGDEWFENDDGWDAQGNKHGYDWFAVSTSKASKNACHRFLYGYDTWHSDPDEDGRTPHAEAKRTLGDIDGDDERNENDALLLWAYLKGESKSIDKNAADINFDGKVDITDGVLLENFVHGNSLDLNNIPNDGLAPTVPVAFVNGTDYDNIKYAYTDRGGYITLPADIFEAPRGMKLSYDIGNVGDKVRITTPFQVVHIKWVEARTPNSSNSDSKSDSKNDSSKSDSSSPDKKNGILGDVNGDGSVDIEDAVAIIQHINGLTPLTADEESRADVSKDKNIDIDDAVTLISYINGNSTF